MDANREYKSSVFTALFNDHDSLLELYNALSGDNFDADTKIGINTLKNVLYMGIYNDVSFTIDDKIVCLIEHQSTISENLPLRLLMYMARVYERIIDRKAVLMKSLVKIPTPEFIVLYNGTQDSPAERTLKLSDAFKEVPKCSVELGSLELTVRILNINPISSSLTNPQDLLKPA